MKASTISIATFIGYTDSELLKLPMPIESAVALAEEMAAAEGLTLKNAYTMHSTQVRLVLVLSTEKAREYAAEGTFDDHLKNEAKTERELTHYGENVSASALRRKMNQIVGSINEAIGAPEAGEWGAPEYVVEIHSNDSTNVNGDAIMHAVRSWGREFARKELAQRNAAAHAAEMAARKAKEAAARKKSYVPIKTSSIPSTFSR